MQASGPGTPRLTIGVALIGIAALAVGLGVARNHPGALAPLLFFAINAGTWVVTRTPRGGRLSRREPRRFRFAIWQVMAASVAVALACTITRAIPQAEMQNSLHAVVFVIVALIALVCLFMLVRPVIGIFRLLLKSGGRG